jgi:hypothetical protein
MSQTKVANYNLQICIDSLRNDPVLNIDSTVPFNNMTVGDKFYPAGETGHWFSDIETPEVLYVVDVAHAVCETTSLVLNQMFVALSSESPR